MNTKYTPGPWLHAHREGSGGMFNTQVFTEDGETIATLHWYPMPTTAQGVTGTYRDANARLIAAAPDLLEALKSIVEAVPVPSSICKERPVYELALAAITKAEGASE